MSRDPLTIIAEVLGEPADQMRNPVNAGYQCPFIIAAVVFIILLVTDQVISVTKHL